MDNSNVVRVPTLGEEMLDRDLTEAEIHEIQNGLLVPSQSVSKRMARMIRVLQGDPNPDFI